MKNIWILRYSGYDFSENIALFLDKEKADSAYQKIMSIEPVNLFGWSSTNNNWFSRTFSIKGSDRQYTIDDHNQIDIIEYIVDEEVLEIRDFTDRREICPDCRGYWGWVENPAGNWLKCNTCKGEGQTPPQW
jgi:DnaJ-class molecular chaperone